MTRVDLSTRMLIEFLVYLLSSFGGFAAEGPMYFFLCVPSCPSWLRLSELHPSCRRHHFLRRILHGFGHDKVQSRLLQNLTSLLNIGSFQPQHNRKLNARLVR